MSGLVKIDREALLVLIQCAYKHGNRHEVETAMEAQLEARPEPTLAEDWAPLVGWFKKYFTFRR